MPLTQGKYALVWECDFDWVMQRAWHAIRSRDHLFYASTHPENGIKGIKLHRFIVSASDDDFVDHQNHNGLDCRRDNMRVATQKQNARNSRKRVGAKQRYKGVYPYNSVAFPFYALITVNGKKINLGKCSSEVNAARLYDKAAIQYHGEFACLNFPINIGIETWELCGVTPRAQRTPLPSEALP